MNNPHEVKTVRCAHCGVVRQEANHWFVILVSGGSFCCSPLRGRLTGTDAGSQALVGRRLRKSEEPVCGQQCAQKVFEKYLAQEGLHRSRSFTSREAAG